MLDLKQGMKMTDYERGLFMNVANGDPKCWPLLFTIKKNFPECVLILQYLDKNKLIGDKLYNWVKVEMNNSPLAAWKYCLSKIHQEKDRKVLFGRDFTNDKI